MSLQCPSLDPDNIQFLHCAQCSFFTLSWSRLVEHCIIGHRERVEVPLFQCEVCSLVGTHVGLLKEHIALKHGQDSQAGLKQLTSAIFEPSTSQPRSVSDVSKSCFLCEHESCSGEALTAHLQQMHNLFNVTRVNFASSQPANEETPPSDVAPSHSLNQPMQSNHVTRVNFASSQQPANEETPPSDVAPSHSLNQPMQSNHVSSAPAHQEETPLQMPDGTVVVQPNDAPLDRQENGLQAGTMTGLPMARWTEAGVPAVQKNGKVLAEIKREPTAVQETGNVKVGASRISIDSLCSALGSRKRKMGLSAMRANKRRNLVAMEMSNGDAKGNDNSPQVNVIPQIPATPVCPLLNNWPVVNSSPQLSLPFPRGVTSQVKIQSEASQRRSQERTMHRKRGRPPKLSVRIFSEEEVLRILRPHVKAADPDRWDKVIIAPEKAYATTVPLRLLVSAYDTDGVQFLRNLIRSYYPIDELVQFSWDVNQKRGRPRVGSDVKMEMDVVGQPLRSLREEPFVQACQDLIGQVFKQAFPDNLAIFINRMLQRIREQPTNNNSPFDLTINGNGMLIDGSLQPHAQGHATSDPVDLSTEVGSHVELDAERALGHHLAPVVDDEPPNGGHGQDMVVICSNLPQLTQKVPKSLLYESYDPDPLRFLRNLIRSAIPHEELRNCTWKGMNTGRPRIWSTTCSPGPEGGKKSLKDDARVQAFMHLVQTSTGRPLPEKIGPHIHQILSTIRNKTSAVDVNSLVTGLDLRMSTGSPATPWMVHSPASNNESVHSVPSQLPLH